MSGKAQAAQTRPGKNDTQHSSLRSHIRSQERIPRSSWLAQQRFQLQAESTQRFQDQSTSTKAEEPVTAEVLTPIVTCIHTMDPA